MSRWSNVRVCDMQAEGKQSVRLGVPEPGTAVLADLELPRRTVYLAVEVYPDGTGAAGVELSGHGRLASWRVEAFDIDPVRAWRKVRRLVALFGLELPRANPGMFGGLSHGEG